MKLKNFYRFTWKKLALFILIIAIPAFFLYSQAGIKDAPPHPLSTPLLIILFWPFLLIYYLESLIIPNVDWITSPIDVFFILMAIGINLVYLYTISSLISSLFRKIRER